MHVINNANHSCPHELSLHKPAIRFTSKVIFHQLRSRNPPEQRRFGSLSFQDAVGDNRLQFGAFSDHCYEHNLKKSEHSECKMKLLRQTVFKDGRGSKKWS